MGTVYIPQETLRYDSKTSGMRPAFDLSPAAKYGTLQAVLPHSTDIMLATDPMRRSVERTMKDFCDDDYVVFMGSPPAIAACIGAAIKNNGGRYKLLHWDREQRAYIPLQFN